MTRRPLRHGKREGSTCSALQRHTQHRFANQLSSLSRAPSFEEISTLQLAEYTLSVNCSRFEAAFSFKFAETMESTAQDMLLHAERPAASTYKRESDAINCTCVVCGGTHLESVLDLGHQPLANAFVSDPLLALQQQEHPPAPCVLPLLRSRAALDHSRSLAPVQKLSL